MDNLEVSKHHYLAVLSQHPLFSKLAINDLRQLAALCEIHTFSPGKVIVQEGALVDSIYFLIKGRAEVRKQVPTQKGHEDQPIALIVPGGSIGLSKVGLFSTSGARTATVIALESVTALRLDLPKFQDFLNNHPYINEAIQGQTDTLRRILFLNSAMPFNDLPIEQLHHFAEQVNEIIVPAGTMLLQQGELGDCCYLIESGSVEISLAYEGQKKVLAELESPAIFGETSLLLNTPHNASARTLSETKLLVLSKTLFSELQKLDIAIESLLSLQLMRARPVPMPNIEVYKQQAADGAQVVTLKNPVAGKYFRLSKYGFFIWEKLNGVTSLSEIALDFYNEFNILSPDIISSLVLDLHHSGFIQLEKGPASTQLKIPWLVKSLVKLRSIMEYRKSLGDVDAWVTRTYQKYMWVFFTVPMQIIFLVITFGLVGFILRFSHAFHLLNVVENKWFLVLVAYGVGSLSFISHELAHAYATKFFGRSVRCFGVGWFWIGPMAYCDTSDMWLANKKARIIVDLAGVYLNIMLAGLAGWLMLFVQSPELLVMLWVFAIVNSCAALANLNPALELDGYFTLMDILDKPNLRESAMEWLAFSLFKKNQPESFWARIKSHKAEAIYWLVTSLYIIIVEIILAYILMSYLFHGLFNIKNPTFNILIICTFILASLATIWGELSSKRIR